MAHHSSHTRLSSRPSLELLTLPFQQRLSGWVHEYIRTVLPEYTIIIGCNLMGADKLYSTYSSSNATNNSDNPRLCIPQPHHTPWQSIPGRHSNSDNPETILGSHSHYPGCHSNSDSRGTILGYNTSAPAYHMAENPGAS